MRILYFIAVFALCCWSCGTDAKKNAADTADSARDDHDHHQHTDISPETADSIISAAGRSSDTVNMVALPPVYEGDIVFQVSDAPHCQVFGKATGWKYNHMGVIFIRPKNGEYVVIEAYDTTRLISLREWVNRGNGQHVMIMRLKNANKIINEKKLDRLKKAARQYAKKPYDRYFGWGDDALYASELVWKIYHEGIALRLGELRKLKTLNLTSGEVSKQLKEKYGNKTPLEEDVITPKDIADSPILEKVFER
ncbi:MAG: peptidoglycan peptidase [Bacteroidetes bacterium]|nr:MAG: peptidoglycan peptidase [Bacteroidota bacterium]